MNLHNHTVAWLESIGADGLMAQDEHCVILKTDFHGWMTINLTFVPAFRHADGSYHTEAEEPCQNCCFREVCKDEQRKEAQGSCPYYRTWWLAHKEAK